ncbi:50S ribosomal protein L21 [Desulfurispirillum indicum]|uniref:Large ribosomal subunit protein bL21 n=1 Tax=Desulfurispirillum indicum (strain ATCC BAA-1389 / DSM 22839 / S5) TaxID=653733 RepID=E6W3S2_DESIS|nr:50S ribosomal protein L21 [Desulfurispirillum indicum]ADU66953.1 ribosomal protein L21 [Desulfurispirillum indicum S5]UCZ56340.1 50S ribosomal protein L21 [Desulfurispirillum indicum]
MQAVIKTCGKQYHVSEGDVLSVSRLEGEIGDVVHVNEVLLLSGDSVVVGAPYVEGAKVSLEILSQYKGKKIIAFKSKRRKKSKCKRGFRQSLTKIRVAKIEQ